MHFLIGFHTSISIESVYELIYLKVEQREIEATDEQLNNLKMAKSKIDNMTLSEKKITNEVIQQFYNSANVITGENYTDRIKNADEIGLDGFFAGRSFYYLLESAKWCYFEGTITQEEFLEYKRQSFEIINSNSKDEILEFLYCSVELIDGWLEKEKAVSAKCKNIIPSLQKGWVLYFCALLSLT